MLGPASPSPIHFVLPRARQNIVSPCEKHGRVIHVSSAEWESIWNGDQPPTPPSSAAPTAHQSSYLFRPTAKMHATFGPCRRGALRRIPASPGLPARMPRARWRLRRPAARGHARCFAYRYGGPVSVLGPSAKPCSGVLGIGCEGRAGWVERGSREWGGVITKASESSTQAGHG